MTTLNQAIRTFNQHKAVRAALDNELKTRERVDVLERQVKQLAREVDQSRAAFQRHALRGFWGRLSWLVSGE
jgi:hypothetical protein